MRHCEYAHAHAHVHVRGRDAGLNRDDDALENTRVLAPCSPYRNHNLCTF